MAGGARGGGGPRRRSGVGPVAAGAVHRRGDDAAACAGGRDDEADASAAGDDEDGRDGDTGPPPWAHGHGRQEPRPGAAWKALTPAQRSALMKRLTTQHAQGMKAFGKCVQAGRSDCEKPLPPGLAKRL